MVDIVLTILCLSGFIYASHRWLKIDFSYAPLFSVSLLGILLFIFALSNQLETGTRILIYAGYILSIICGIDAWKNQNREQLFIPVKIFMIFVLLIVLSYLITLGMQFTVIDDYVYWGIIGKYLYFNNHLPDANTTIIARHLAYTPGTGLFHYFFYTLAGKYSPSISYFAQNILLISAVFVVIKKKSIQKSLVLLCCLVILLTLFSGSVFTKLQVDYLLSVYFFALLWIYFREQPSFITIFTISAPVLFLFLIKEIGFVLSLLILVIIFFDLIFQKSHERKTKIKFIIYIVLLGGLLCLLKQTWAEHCQIMGFGKFNSAVNMDSIRQSFHIFSNQDIQKGFLIFLKDIFIGPADRLNIPYAFWYLSIIFIWFKILGKQNDYNKSRFILLGRILSVAFIIYLVMIYFLQIIVFKIGINGEHTIGLTRYLNIFFSQIVFFLSLLYIEQLLLSRQVSNKVSFSFILVVILVLGFSRIETTLRLEDHHKTAGLIAQKIENNIDKEQKQLICIVPGSNDNHLWIKLLYHLFPNRINHGAFPVKTREIFLSKLSQYDYVLFNNPGEKIVKWISPFTDHADEHNIMQPGGTQSYYKINIQKRSKADSENMWFEEKKIRLEKLF